MNRILNFSVFCAVVLLLSGCVKSPQEQTVFSVSPSSFDIPGQGGSASFTVKSSQSWTVKSDDWISVSPTGGNAAEHGIKVNFSVGPNDSDARNGKITVTSSGKSAGLTVTQASHSDPAKPSLSGKRFAVIGNSMLYYGGMVQKGSQLSDDPGLFSKLLKKHHGNDLKVFDCTFGDHQLSDFISLCQYSGSCKGKDHLASLDFSSIDYVLISQAGNNSSSFYSDAAAVFERFIKANPNVRLYYINHVYSVYKNHQNVLGNLKTLHDKLGVTIINCGQLAYDIYTGRVKVPGGTLSYSDRYTFVNHKGSDTHHPNPLMGYIMAQMAYCAVSGDSPQGEDYMSVLTSSKFGDGTVAYSSYYSKYYETQAALPFTTVLTNKTEMAGIQELIPQYIDRY